MTEIEILVKDDGKRLDAYIASELDLSRNRAQNMIRSGSISVNGFDCKPSYEVQSGDRISVSMEEDSEWNVEPQDIPIDIVYEDQDICVVNKPQGMVVHPAPGHYSGTLVNALLFHLKELSSIGGVKRPGIVHRIDQMTSGLLVIAKNDKAHQSLSEQFKTHTAGREYIAIIDGNLKEDSGTVNQPIGRNPKDRKKMAVNKNGKEAITHWTVLERFGSYSLISIKLETGRTHQIRVHMAYLHHPVSGDPVYGSKSNKLGLKGQALHGYKLHFKHPANGKELLFFAPVPEYFLNALGKLGADIDAVKGSLK